MIIEMINLKNNQIQEEKNKQNKFKCKLKKFYKKKT